MENHYATVNYVIINVVQRKRTISKYLEYIYKDYHNRSMKNNEVLNCYHLTNINDKISIVFEYIG